MSDGAFRDGSGALERAAVLEEENETLHKELVELRMLVETLRTQIDDIRAERESGDADAEARRIRDERDDLKIEVKQMQRIEKQLHAEQDAQRALRRERDELRTALAKVTQENEMLDRQLGGESADLEAARLEIEKVREDAGLPVVPPNKDAYMQRLVEERDELLREVRQLREAQARAPRGSLLGALFGRR
jgi:hypothetical protein